MMEFGLNMVRLAADIEVTKRERETGVELTGEEKSRIFGEHFGRHFEAGINAAVTRDMARVRANMPPPIWIKPAIWGAAAFVLTIAVMLAL